MRSHPLGAALTALTLLAAPACSNHDDDACTTLTKQICGDGAIACDRVTPWLAAQLAGPDGRPLAATERTQVCRQVLADPDAFTGFREAARSALATTK